MEIKLVKRGKTLSARTLADKIFSEYKGTEKLIIDFAGVEEATPSFCHEMFTILLGNKKTDLKIINTKPSIKTQLNKALSAISFGSKKASI